MKPLHKSSVQEEVLVEGSSWFFPYDNHAMAAMKEVQKNYDKYRVNAKKLGYKNRTNFSFEKMKEALNEILTNHVPVFPKQIELMLPKLNLPKLEKID